MSVFTVMISQRQHTRLLGAPVPRALAQIGIGRFGVADATRFAVIGYLAMPINPQPSATESGDICLQVNVPIYLACQLAERAAAEHQSKAAIVRAAIDLFLPPGRDEVAAGPTRPAGLNDAMVRAQFGDRTEQFTTSGRY